MHDYWSVEWRADGLSRYPRFAQGAVLEHIHKKHAPAKAGARFLGSNARQ